MKLGEAFVVEVSALAENFHSPQHSLFENGEGRVGTPFLSAGDLGRSEPRPGGEPAMVLELVIAPTEGSDSKDRNFGHAPRESTPRHEGGREVKPGPEEPLVTAEGQEEIRRAGPAHAAGEPGESTDKRPRPGKTDETRTAHDGGWIVVKSTTS